MKKALALGIASICALSLTSSVFAETINSAGENPIEAKYNVSSTFSVTIPAEINFPGATASVDETVKAEDVIIYDTESLSVSMISTNGNLVNGSSYIPYSFTLDETTTAIAAETEYDLISVASSEKSGKSKNIKFTAGGLDNVTLAGRHSDTLTFKVSIVQATITDARDGKKYTTIKLGGKTWMSQNLAYVPEGVSGVTVDSDSGEVYYSWKAATNTTDPVCPSGWILPSESDFNILLELFDGNSIVLHPFYSSRAGFIKNGVLNTPGTRNGYWTSDLVFGSYSNLLYSNNGSLTMTAQDQSYGYSVRCIAE